MFQVFKIAEVPGAGAEVSLKIGLIGKEAKTFNTFHKNLLQARIYLRLNFKEYVGLNIEMIIKACKSIHKDADTLTEKRQNSINLLKRWVLYTLKPGITYQESLETLAKIYPHVYYLLPPSTHIHYLEIKEFIDEICRLNALMILEIKGRVEFPFVPNNELKAIA